MSLLNCWNLRGTHQDAAEDETVQDTGNTNAEDDPHGNKNHFPAPGHKLVQFQGQEDKLQSVDCEKHFQLKTTVMLHGPHTGTDTGHTAKDQWDKDEHPEVVSGSAEAITGEELEHEQDEVQRQADEHRLEGHICVDLYAVMGALAPHDTSHNGPQRRD